MVELNALAIASGAWLSKAVTEFFSTIRPIALPTGDMDVRFIGSPQSWKPTSAHGLACHGTTGDLSWRWLDSTNGFLQVYISLDGTAETLIASDVAIPNQSSINGIRWTRTAATGDVKFYTSRDEGTSWQQLGSTIPSAVGALHLSAVDIKVGVAPPGSASYRGTVRSFDLRINSVSVCNLDLTKVWKRINGPWIDTHGNEWVKNGVDTPWVVDVSALGRRRQMPDLANMSGWSGDFATAETVTVLRASVALDFPSIAASGGTQELTIALSGALTTDGPVSVSARSSLNAGLVASAWVSATDTVTVRLTNVTSGAIDPASTTFDVSLAKAPGSIPTAGVVTCGRIIIPEDRNVSKITSYVLVGGTGVTAAQNYFALHNLDGTRLGVTAALSSTDLTVGHKVIDMVTAVDVRAGIYVVKMLMNASTTPPTFAVSGTSPAVNAGGSATSGWRFYTEDTGQTSIPATPIAAAARLDKGYLLGVA